MVMDKRQNIALPTPVLQAQLLDDLNVRMALMIDMMRREEPIGDLMAHPTINVTTQPQEIDIGEWLEATIWNDGAGNVQVSNSPRSYDSGKSYLATGERLVLNNKRRSRKYLYFVGSAAATCRMYYQ